MQPKDVKTLRSVASVGLIALASIYLTFIVDVYTLNTVPQKLFVFLYFCAMSAFLAWLKRKYIGATQKQTAAIAVLLAALAVLAFHERLIPRWEKQEVILRANVTGDFPTGEVWLVGAEMDGERVEASALGDAEMNGWIFNADYDDYVFYPGEVAGDNSLTLSLTAESVDLIFAANPWSGSVLVETNGDISPVVLCAGESQDDQVTYSVRSAPQSLGAVDVLRALGAIVVLAFLLAAAFSCIRRKQYDKKSLFTLVYLLDAAALFCTSPLIDPSKGTRLVLAAVTAGVLIAESGPPNAALEKYAARGKKAALWLIAVYASLASFGYRFFLYGDTRPTFSAEGVLYCALGTIWFYPLLKAMLFCLEKAGTQHEGRKRTKKESRRAFWVLLAVLSVCQCIPLLAFWPGGFPLDCVDQLNQALGVYGLNDWHPVIHTLFFRAVILVFHKAGAIVAVQMIFFVWLCALVLKEGYDRGIGLLPLCLFCGAFLLLPNQVFSSILAEKDTPYALALLWGTWLLYKMVSRTDKSLLFYTALTIDLFLVCTVRHNGIVTFAAMAFFCAIYALRNKTERNRLLASVLASVLLLIGYKGPLFRALHVVKNGMSGYTVMLCAVGSCINKNLPLSEDTNALMARVMPMEDWKNYYGRFVGIDYYMWGGGSGMNLEGLTAKEAFSAYFDALLRYPDVVIKDRLDGTNLLWDVSQPWDTWTLKNFDNVNMITDEFDPRVGELFDLEKLVKSDSGPWYYNRSQLAEMYRKASSTSPNQAADMLLWRTGAYLILFWVLLLYWWANQKKNMFCCAVPMLGNLAGLLLVLCHQSFRYVYPVQLLVVTLLFFTLIDKNTVRYDASNAERAEE